MPRTPSPRRQRSTRPRPNPPSNPEDPVVVPQNPENPNPTQRPRPTLSELYRRAEEEGRAGARRAQGRVYERGVENVQAAPHVVARSESENVIARDLDAARAARGEGALGDDDDDDGAGGDEDASDAEVGSEMSDTGARLSHAYAELRNEMEERIVTLQPDMIQEQRQMMEAQTNLIQDLFSRLRVSGEASGAPMPPQPPTPQPPTPHYPRLPSPTPSNTSSFHSDVDQTLFK
ncbi:hypothetical protein HK104_006697, partial [Borealophlyctis nickersoniae]